MEDDDKGLLRSDWDPGANTESLDCSPSDNVSTEMRGKQLELNPLLTTGSDRKHRNITDMALSSVRAYG